MQLVGSLIYLIAISPSLSYSVSFISRFMTTLKVEHWIAAKGVLRYVKETLEFGILYNRSKDSRLCVYIDLDWAGCVDDRNQLLDMHSTLAGATCNSPFIDRSGISRSNERSV
jgi:hypothetical protein